jgi:DNA polymerase-1
MLEEQLERPFEGDAGGLLKKALNILRDQADLDLDTIGKTYAVKCRPENDKNPPVAAKRECLKYLDSEIEAYAPQALVALGSQALSALTDGEISAVGPNRLRVLEYKGLPLMVTFHPSAVLYDRTKAQDLLDDLHAYLVEEIWRQEGVEQPFTVRLVNTPEGFNQLREALHGELSIGLDIETDGFTPHVLTVALATEGTAYVLPAFHPESKLSGREVVDYVVDEFLRDPHRTVVGQNVKYDLSMLMRAAGKSTSPVLCSTEDSMLFHYMMNEHSTARNLDYLSRAYTGLGGYKEEVNHSALREADLKTLARYNGRDAAVPPIIISKIRSQLDADGYRSEAMERFYSRLTPFVATMEAAGIKVDRQRLAEVKDELTIKMDTLRNEVEDMAPDVNLDSPKQLSEHLYETLGLEVPDVKDAITPAGQPSTREDVISHLKHPFVERLLEYRGTAKLLRTYVGGIEDNLWPDGSVHPQFFIAKTDFGGTVTGRLSCKRPALQTIPRGSDIRSVFRPRREGGILLEVDASQAELRVATVFSSDRTLVEIFKGGSDPHQATADLCGVDRHVGKTINFASIYGVTWWGLVERAGLSEALAKRVAKTIKKEWAGLYSFFDTIKAQAVRTGEVSTPYGRWRRVPGAEPSTPRGRMLMREAANFVIQAPASDFVQTLGSHLAKVLEGEAVPIMSNHDGLYFDIFDRDRLQHVVDTLLTSLEQFPILVNDVFGVELTVPFEWDIKVGHNLQEMKEWD